MLKDERETSRDGSDELPLTYGSYLHIPEILSLQAPLSHPPVHDEMFFIIAQQIQELWFKQILHELRAAISVLDSRDILATLPYLDRSARIFEVLGAEVALMETLPPQEFQRFRHVLVSSSGFESEQFRELEFASGLRDTTFLKLLDKHVHFREQMQKWPRTLHDAFISGLGDIEKDPGEALLKIYTDVPRFRKHYMLCEALCEYEVQFSGWRFHHIKLVERTIGDNSPGTAGSAGAGYLGKTLSYRFFPELWQVRNRLTNLPPSKDIS